MTSTSIGFYHHENHKVSKSPDTLLRYRTHKGYRGHFITLKDHWLYTMLSCPAVHITGLLELRWTIWESCSGELKRYRPFTLQTIYMSCFVVWNVLHTYYECNAQGAATAPTNHDPHNSRKPVSNRAGWPLLNCFPVWQLSIYTLSKPLSQGTNNLDIPTEQTHRILENVLCVPALLEQDKGY